MRDFAKATMLLFHAVPLQSEETGDTFPLDNEANVLNGFFITEEAAEACPWVNGWESIAFIREHFGYDAGHFNRAFHKKFANVIDSRKGKLLAQQLLHYLTTYIPDMLGEESVIYVPVEKLDLPAIYPGLAKAGHIKMTVFDFITAEEIERRVRQMLSDGRALNHEAVQHLAVIIEAQKLEIDFARIANKEMRARLYDACHRLPEHPVEFLRFLVFKAAGKSLLIKDRATIKSIRASYFDAAPYLAAYAAAHGLEPLAACFLRFKPLWLAFKSQTTRKVINRLRKLARRENCPLCQQVLDRVTSSSQLDLLAFRRELDRVTLWKKVALLNAIRLRQSVPENMLYIIRNGKLFVQKNADGAGYLGRQEAAQLLQEAIVGAIRPQVAGRRIYIPERVSYAMPTSGKQSVGGIPYGSSLSLGSSVVVAVHWDNLPCEGLADGARVDLDLHMISRKYSVGWDNYLLDSFDKRSAITFSGDMVSAPITLGGATEAFYISPAVKKETMLVSLNNYTGNRHVPYRLIVDDAEEDRVNKDYFINVHTLMANIESEIDRPESVVGLLAADAEGEKKFYFADLGFGLDIVAGAGKVHRQAISALRSRFDTQLTLREVLEEAGAVLTAEGEPCEYDLSPERLNSDALTDLLLGKRLPAGGDKI